MTTIIGVLFSVFGLTTAIRETWILSKPPNSLNETFAKYFWIFVGSVIGTVGLKLLKLL